MRTTFLPAALILAATAAAAAPTPVEVAAAWSRPAAAGGTGAGFMTLINRGKAVDALTAVESPVASRVEIHRSSMSNGVASMHEVKRVAVPAGGRAAFAPGGYHLMFMGLKRPLKVGETVPATLIFASGARVKAAFEVRIAPPAAGHSGH